jgi:tetratricopeptide (TPR) repeat protein
MGRGIAVVAAVIACLVASCATPFEKGLAYQQRGDYRSATGAYQSAINDDPNNIEAYVNLGISYNLSRQFPLAIPPLERAVQMAPNNPGAHFSLGISYENVGRTEEALRAYNNSLAIDPGFFYSDFSLGMLYARMGDLPNAVAALDAYLGLAQGVPSEAPSLQLAWGLRNDIAADLEAMEQERQRQLWLAQQQQQFDAPTPEPPPTAPRAAGASCDDAAVSIVGALGGEGLRRQGVDEGRTIGGVAMQVGGILIRDASVEHGLHHCFPNATPGQLGLLKRLVTVVLEGELSAKNLGLAAIREDLVQKLQEQFPNRADAIAAADFLVDLKLKKKEGS